MQTEGTCVNAAAPRGMRAWGRAGQAKVGQGRPRSVLRVHTLRWPRRTAPRRAAQRRAAPRCAALRMWVPDPLLSGFTCDKAPAKGLLKVLLQGPKNRPYLA